MSARAATAYKRVELESAPKHQIVDRLFERFALDIAQAKAAIAKKDVKAKATAIDHGLLIVTELRAALDHAAAPELCANLDALYGFVLEKLVFANLKLDVKALDQALKIMTDLAESFRQAHGR